LVTKSPDKYGYGLRGIYSLEEYYAKDLQAYYTALAVGGNGDYYEGYRASADITGFLEYFITGMADSFTRVKIHAKKTAAAADQSNTLRSLTPRQRQTLQLFFEREQIAAQDGLRRRVTD
jgi:hypothetical protein